MLKNDLSAKKRMILFLVIFFISCIVVTVRLSYLQFIKSAELQAKTEEQQRSTRQVGARRGTIYDSSEETVLAISSTVYTVTVNPMKIPNEKKEMLAKKLAETFELEYEKVLKRLKKKSSIETIIKIILRENKRKRENDIFTCFNSSNWLGCDAINYW